MDEEKNELIEKTEELTEETEELTEETEELDEITEELVEEPIGETAEEKPEKTSGGAKRVIAWVLALCLAFGAGIGVTRIKKNGAEEAPQEVIPQEEVGEQREEMKAKMPDLDAAYATHKPEEIVATIAGHDITWREYFYWLAYDADYIYYYLQTYYNYYGVNPDWTDAMDDEGTTFAQYVVEGAEMCIAQQYILLDYAKEQGFTLSEEKLAEIDAEIEEYKLQNCGENATEEDFAAFLAEQYSTPELFRTIVTNDYVFKGLFDFLYGERGENVSDEDALAYLTDNGYEFHCNHILLLTMDMTTGEELDEETVAQKKAQADELYAELSAIEDAEERVERFKELKEEYCEDSGKTNFPDGYVFTAGMMVSVFEETTAELEDYQLSEPVQSEYGYHIILRLPADPDATVDYSDEGTALSARMLYADKTYGEYISTAIDEAVENVVYADNMKGFDLFK